MIALLDVAHLRAGLNDDAGGLVAEQQRSPGGGIVHAVELRVADAAGKRLDRHLVGPRLGQRHFVNDDTSSMTSGPPTTVWIAARVVMPGVCPLRVPVRKRSERVAAPPRVVNVRAGDRLG